MSEDWFCNVPKAIIRSVWETRFCVRPGNRDLLLAALGPNFIRAHPFFFVIRSGKSQMRYPENR